MWPRYSRDTALQYQRSFHWMEDHLPGSIFRPPILVGREEDPKSMGRVGEPQLSWVMATVGVRLDLKTEHILWSSLLEYQLPGRLVHGVLSMDWCESQIT